MLSSSNNEGSQPNIQKQDKKPTIIFDYTFCNITVDGPNENTIDYLQYRLAQEIKNDKNFCPGYTINHKSYKKILKDPSIRKHYLNKKLEKYEIK